MNVVKPPPQHMASRAGVSAAIRREPRSAPPRPKAPPTRKGSQSRDNLKAAALRALEKKGYRNLRLTDIADEAGVNISLVYHYFQDKAALVFDALRDVIDVRRVIEAEPSRPHEPFAAIYFANKLFADFYQAHPGLIRSLVHFDEENPEFHELYARVNREWSSRIAETIQKRCPDAGLSRSEAMATAYAVGGMVEKFLFELYVDCNPELTATFPEPEDAARFLAVLWYRTIYLQNPAAADLAQFGKFAKLTLTRADN